MIMNVTTAYFSHANMRMHLSIYCHKLLKKYRKKKILTKYFVHSRLFCEYIPAFPPKKKKAQWVNFALVALKREADIIDYDIFIS